jgi:transcriptional regulator with XRE-family HTH domain
MYSEQGKPTNPNLHEVYRDEVESYLEKFAINYKEFRSLLGKSFEEGALKMHRRKIGDWIERNRMEMRKTQEEVARIVGVDVSAVTKWINGDSNITQKNLVKIKCLFSVTGIGQEEVAPRELALEGYRQAIASARSLLTGQVKTPPSREDLLCLFHLYSGPDWGRLRLDGAGDCQFRALARLLLKKVSSPRATAPANGKPCRVECGEHHVCHGELRCPNLGDVRHINSILEEWGTAWLICIECLSEEGAL